MSAANEGWYLSEPSADEAAGPLTRAALAAELASGRWSAEAVVWHVDLSEWRLAARALGAPSGQAGTGHGSEPLRHAPARSDPKPPAGGGTPAPGDGLTKAERAEQRRKRKALKDQALQGAGGEDGQRLLSHAADAGMNPAAIAQAREAQARAQAAQAAVKPGAKAATPDAAAAGEKAILLVRRLLARLVDTLTLGTVAAAAAYGVLAQRAEAVDWPAAPNPIQLAILGVLALVPLEALALMIFRTTPGKALLGLSVCSRGGSRPDPIQATGRAITVAWRGMGLGLPILGQIAWLVALAQSQATGVAPWDAARGLEVRAVPVAAGRWQAALFVVVAAIMLLESGTIGDIAGWVRSLVAAGAVPGVGLGVR